MRVSWVFVIVVMWVGCGEERRGSHGTSPDGGGGMDAGGPGADAGGGGDGGSGVDGGHPGTDAGAMTACSGPGPGGDCVLLVPHGRFGPLSAACLPRCSAATGRAYHACTTQSCRNAAIDADTTSGVP